MPDVPYSIADIQNYFEFLIKKHETLAGNPSVQIYPNEIKNRIVFKAKTGYELELSSSKTMKLLGSSKNDVDQDNDGEDIPKLESVKVVLVYFNRANNNYQQASKVLFTFDPNKEFGQLNNILSHSLIMLSTINTEFSSIEVWFTDQKSEPLEIEDSVNMTLIIG